MLNDVPIRSVGIVTSHKSVVRGNKYHRSADKYIYVMSWAVEWLYRGSDQKRTNRATFEAGDFSF